MSWSGPATSSDSSWPAPWQRSLDLEPLQRRDALLQRRVGGEHAREQVSAGTVADLHRAKGGGTVIQDTAAVRDLLQAPERADHSVLAFQLCPHGVGAEFASARVSHHDQAREDAEEDLRDVVSDEVAEAQAAPVAVAAQRHVDHVADNAGQEDHE